MFDTMNAKMLNGLNVRDVEALIETVKADPANGNTRWKVNSTWQGRTHNRSVVKSFGIGDETVDREFSIDIDEPEQLGGANQFANPQEHLMAALNSCMMVGYVALCSLKGIEIDSLEIETRGEIDLRGFLGLSDDVAPGYEELNYAVRISGNATREEFEEIHQMVMKTSPNFHNISKAIRLNATLKAN